MEIINNIEDFLNSIDDYRENTLNINHFKHEKYGSMILLTYLDSNGKKYGFGKKYKGDIK